MRWLLALFVVANAAGCAGHKAGNTATDAPAGDTSRDANPDVGSGSGVARGVYILDETFNADPTAAAPAAPWTVTTSPQGAVAVQEVPFATDKSAQLTKPDATGATSLAATFLEQHGRIVFEAKVMAAETAGFKAIPYIYDAAGDAVASIAFQDGKIVAHVGQTATTIQTFAAAQWYRIRLVVDTDAGVFDLFVDGVRQQHAAALRTAAASVNSVRFYMDGANTGTLSVDEVEVYTEAAFIGGPPAPVFDAKAYGATGNGTTDDTAAIQAAIAAATGTGGSVVLTGGTFLSSTLTLGSSMTFYVDASAVLLGEVGSAAYPVLTPATGNTQLSNTQRALLYANAVHDVAIDGGGTIDGQGDAFSGVEATRPLLFWSVLAQNVSVRDVFFRKGAVWSVVFMETDHVLVDHVDVQSNGITHDGIDVVDGNDITVQHVAVNAGDDAMCLKSGVRRGIVGMTVKDSVFTGNNGGSNGIKFGTATYGAFKNITIEDSWVKNVQYAAMAVESRQGSDISAVAFQRIELFGTGAAFFVYLAQQATTHPIGDVPKLGSIDGVSFTDVIGTTASWPNSPHQGSLITGQIYSVDGKTYPITNLAFTRVAVVMDGGSTVVPAAPAEATPNQYPESNMFGDLPAWGYYLRHVQGVTFTGCATTAAATDARPVIATDDVGGMTGAPTGP